MPRRPLSSKTPHRPTRGRSFQAGLTVAALASGVVALGTLVGAHMARQDHRPQVALALLDLSPPVAEDAAPRVAIPLAAEDPAVTPEPHAVPALPAWEDEAAFARLYEEPVPLDNVNSTGLSADAAAPPAAIEHAVERLAAIKPAPVSRPPWQRHAVPVSVPSGQPMVAIVIDDLGLNRPAARRAIALPGPLTLSFMSYAGNLPALTRRAKTNGHELMLHVPMEPSGSHVDPGPHALRLGQPADELRESLRWALGRFDGFVGINNHMGSRFTASSEAVALVMREVRARGLLFLDSLTSPKSVGWAVADRAGVPYARRDIFIDHDWRDARAIRQRLAELERLARRRGYAVGIGHPHATTLHVLTQWLPEARRRGIALVPISAIVRHRIRVANEGAGAAG